MHEAALLRDLRRKLRTLDGAGAPGTIVRVTVWLGALAHLSAAHLRDAWPIVTAGTPADGAELVVTASTDLSDPRAQAVVLASFVVRDGAPGTTPRSERYLPDPSRGP